MKNKIYIFLLLVFGSLVFNSCFKKGEEDPFLSLQSRKARVVGSWEAKKYYYKNVQTDSSGSIWTYEFFADSTKCNFRLTVVGGGGYIGNGDFSMDWDFDSDGTYSEKVSVSGDKDVTEGDWNFSGGVGDAKNKSQIVLFEKSYTNSKNLVWKHEGDYVSKVFDIVGLRGKKMHLHNHEIRTYPKGEVRIDEYEYDILIGQKKK